MSETRSGTRREAPPGPMRHSGKAPSRRGATTNRSDAPTNHQCTLATAA
jgi:hypothetical protein